MLYWQIYAYYKSINDTLSDNYEHKNVGPIFDFCMAFYLTDFLLLFSFYVFILRLVWVCEWMCLAPWQIPCAVVAWKLSCIVLSVSPVQNFGCVLPSPPDLFVCLCILLFLLVFGIGLFVSFCCCCLAGTQQIARFCNPASTLWAGENGIKVMARSHWFKEKKNCRVALTRSVIFLACWRTRFHS